MRIYRQRHDDESLLVALLDDDGESVAVVSGFLRHLAARGCSPNTLTAYAYDLRHLWTFLAEQQLAWMSSGLATRSGCWSTSGQSRAGARASDSR